MSYVESFSGHRVVGRLERGAKLPDALEEVCREAGLSAAIVRAEGVLSHVELACFDIESGEYVSCFEADGGFELVALQGNLSMMGSTRILNAHAMLAYNEHGQCRTTGGQLRAATVYSVEFVIEGLDDVVLERSMDAAIQLPVLSRLESVAPTAATSEPQPQDPVAAPQHEPVVAETKPSRATAKETSKPTRPTAPEMPQPPRREKAPHTPAPKAARASANAWKAAAQRAEEILERDETGDEEAIELSPGDILLHPRLGECTVVRVEDESAAYIRLPQTRRISKLALDLVRLEFVETKGRNAVYKVEAARR